MPSLDPSPVAPSPFFVLRTPLLPFETLPRCRADLQALLERRIVREAIIIAAPAIDAQLSVWCRDPESDAGRKIERALLRYVTRMVGRATPFGMFAGCAMGHIADGTQLKVHGERRHTRLDMDYVVALTETLSRDPQLRPDLRFT